jgi:hypothetical protein
LFLIELAVTDPVQRKSGFEGIATAFGFGNINCCVKKDRENNILKLNSKIGVYSL